MHNLRPNKIKNTEASDYSLRHAPRLRQRTFARTPFLEFIQEENVREVGKDEYLIS